MKFKQKGFSVVEILIVIVLVSLIGSVGWYVWQSKNKKPASTDDSQTTQTQPSTQTQASSCNAASEEQNSWAVVSSHENNFTMCVPGGWTLVSDTQSDTFRVAPPFVVVSGEKATIQNEEIGGKDGTSDMFQVLTAKESYQGWTSNDAEKSDFTLNDGTKGIRYYTKYTNIGVGGGIGPVEGDEDYEYLFEKNGKFIHAGYTIHPGTQKHLNTVEEVLKTLKIN